ncbi:MAG: anthranilate synthase component I family protein [Caulobacteraceae bacterium]|nr:anthranilate synthase component I family protein [Caulobacteraceae bacterium]
MRATAILKADWKDPVEVLGVFAEEPFALGFLSGGGGPRGRWSYLLRSPDAVLVVDPQNQSDALGALKALIGEVFAGDPDGPPFQGGVAGLCAYELGDRIEPLGLGRLDDWPDLACARYPALLAFDHEARKVLAVGCGGDQAEATARGRLALTWLDEAASATPSRPLPGALARDLTGEAPETYERGVADVVARIGAGEIFQANIARRWRGRLAAGVKPFDLLRRLAARSPAPFAAYLRLPDRAVVSNTPERFIEVRPGAGRLTVETRPIKGTAPRGSDEAHDHSLIQALESSAKDRAENLMIVDLMRNDLARVCEAGDVATPELFRVESFANVHHLVSTVTGRLAPGRDAIDLLAATFPPGSITGAPKVQAMKVIAQLEAPRGPFFGAMFWAGFDGGFDSNVLIRTAAFVIDGDGWDIEARAGGGVVADSDPVAERLETEAKISALLGALTETVSAADLPLGECR